MTNEAQQTPGNTKSPGDHHNVWIAIGVFAIFIAMIPINIALVLMVKPSASSTLQIAPVAMGGTTIKLSPGETVYQSACMLCHGPDAQGVVGLGKPLNNNAYIQESDDSELFRNIAEGRLPDHPLNTTSIMMPARGAQNITDTQINDVMVYMRSIQNPSEPLTDMAPWILEKPMTEVAFDGPGRDLFIAMCSACHGANGEGMDGLGKPFTSSLFIKDSTDKEIITLVKMGRPIWDAANTTGVDMPSKGGNPAMSDDELNEIIIYIRSISALED
ncbi:MAG: c-type cytochrome [Phycisphaerales bacterium]|nr:c-type cytochrome [Phycisphaerales bacterium]